MNTKEYVESLFSGYEVTENLKDFMEELMSNLDARIANLVRKGLSEQGAFDKACAELGDISVLAQDLSLKKRREVYEEVYMDVRKYISPGRMAAFVIFGIIALFGIIIAIISFLATGWFFHRGWLFDPKWPFGRDIGIITFLGALLPFIVTSISGFTFLGLTQDTKSHFPMSRKRAAWYTAATAMISFGLIVMPITYFAVRFDGVGNFAIIASIAVLIPFVLPGGGLLAYLVLSEKPRLKPWAASLQEVTIKQQMEMYADPAAANRYGLFSGAIWIFAAALFFLLGFLLGFKFSWVVFIFAVAIQLVLQGFMMKKK